MRPPKYPSAPPGVRISSRFSISEGTRFLTNLPKATVLGVRHLVSYRCGYKVQVTLVTLTKGISLRQTKVGICLLTIVLLVANRK